METRTSNIVYLVGFMGSGKSSVGRALATRLGYSYTDTDEVVQDRVGKTVAEIFAQDGEESFRQMEREALLSAVDSTPVVVATGGGLFVDLKARERIHKTGVSVWLDVPLNVILGRVDATGDRPLFGDLEAMALLLAQREPSYALADIRIESGVSSVDELATEIQRKLAMIN